MAAPPKKAGGLSLYADLLEPDKSKAGRASISGAAVRYDIKDSTAGGEEGAVKKKDASLQFQPIKRPQVPQKMKPKSGGGGAGASSSSMHKGSSSIVSASVTASSPEKQQQRHPSSTTGLPQPPSVPQSNFEDWVADDDDYYYQNRKPKHERGGRRKKKKNKPQERQWDWDDIYDPTLPNNYADYKGSEEQAREIRDWKARLYYHQLKEAKRARKDGGMGSDDDEDMRSRPMNTMFAPPSNLSFAPPSTLNFAPPSFDQGARDSRMDEDDGDDYYPPDISSSNDREDTSYDAPPAFARASVPDDATGEDAYMRRMRMSGMPAPESPPAAAPPPPAAAPPPPAAESTPPPPPVARLPDADIDNKRADAAAKIAAFKARLASQKPTTPQPVQPPPEIQPSPPPAPPPELDQEPTSTTISRAPVRYTNPPPPEDNTLVEPTSNDAPTPPAEQARSSRPGQKGFAERLLKRYGWEKGQGLGASGEGITTAIVAKAEKAQKRADADGGGWAAPANMGKIVGGKKRKLDPSSTQSADEEETITSEVVKFEGMLANLDVAREIEEGNLMQEIGEEMQAQYGNVERVFIWREEVGGGNEVFVKFTSAASAVRAVQGMHGAEFAGNEVKAGFWASAKFEAGEYA